MSSYPTVENLTWSIFPFFYSDEENWDTWGEDNVIEDSTNVEDYFESASKIDEFLKDSNIDKFMKSPKASESLVQGSDKTLQTNIDDLVRNVQELDILKFKQPTKAKVKEEVDYFAEMIPVIAKRKSSLEQFQDDLETSKQVQFDKIIDIDVNVYIFTFMILHWVYKVKHLYSKDNYNTRALSLIMKRVQNPYYF